MSWVPDPTKYIQKKIQKYKSRHRASEDQASEGEADGEEGE